MGFAGSGADPSLRLVVLSVEGDHFDDDDGEKAAVEEPSEAIPRKLMED